MERDSRILSWFIAIVQAVQYIWETGVHNNVHFENTQYSYGLKPPCLCITRAPGSRRRTKHSDRSHRKKFHQSDRSNPFGAVPSVHRQTHVQYVLATPSVQPSVLSESAKTSKTSKTPRRQIKAQQSAPKRKTVRCTLHAANKTRDRRHKTRPIALPSAKQGESTAREKGRHNRNNKVHNNNKKDEKAARKHSRV